MSPHGARNSRRRPGGKAPSQCNPRPPPPASPDTPEEGEYLPHELSWGPALGQGFEPCRPFHPGPQHGYDHPRQLPPVMDGPGFRFGVDDGHDQPHPPPPAFLPFESQRMAPFPPNVFMPGMPNLHPNGDPPHFRDNFQYDRDLPDPQRLVDPPYFGPEHGRFGDFRGFAPQHERPRDFQEFRHEHGGHEQRHGGGQMFGHDGGPYENNQAFHDERSRQFGEPAYGHRFDHGDFMPVGPPPHDHPTLHSMDGVGVGEEGEEFDRPRQTPRVPTRATTRPQRRLADNGARVARDSSQNGPPPTGSPHFSTGSPHNETEGFSSSSVVEGRSGMVELLPADSNSREQRTVAYPRESGPTSYFSQELTVQNTFELNPHTSSRMERVGQAASRLDSGSSRNNNDSSEVLRDGRGNGTNVIRLPQPQNTIDQLRHAIAAKNMEAKFNNNWRQRVDRRSPLHSVTAAPSPSSWPEPGEPLLLAGDSSSRPRPLQSLVHDGFPPQPYGHEEKRTKANAANEQISRTSNLPPRPTISHSKQPPNATQQAEASSVVAKPTTRVVKRKFGWDVSPEGWRSATSKFRQGSTAPLAVAKPFLKAAETTAMAGKSGTPGAAEVSAAGVAAKEIESSASLTSMHVAVGLSPAVVVARSLELLAASQQPTTSPASKSSDTSAGKPRDVGNNGQAAVMGTKASKQQGGTQLQASVQPARPLPPTTETLPPSRPRSSPEAKILPSSPLDSRLVRANDPPPRPPVSSAGLSTSLMVKAATHSGVTSGGAETAALWPAGDTTLSARKAAAVAASAVGVQSSRGAEVVVGDSIDSTRWHDYALVLVGAAAAVLPRGALKSVLSIPGTRWVSRYGLRDAASLPPEMNPTMAKALAERLPSCVSHDDNEAGLEFLVLMTFVSAADKAAAVARMAELRLDTSDFKNSPRLQVEQLRAIPPPPSSPAPPVPNPAASSATASAPLKAAPKSRNLQDLTVVEKPASGTGGVKGGGNAREEELRRRVQQEIKAKRVIAAAAVAASAAAAAAAVTTEAQTLIPKSKNPVTLGSAENATKSPPSNSGKSTQAVVACTASAIRMPKVSGAGANRDADANAASAPITGKDTSRASALPSDSSKKPAAETIGPVSASAAPAAETALAVTKAKQKTPTSRTDTVANTQGYSPSTGSRSSSPIPKRKRTPSPVPNPKVVPPLPSIAASDGGSVSPPRRSTSTGHVPVDRVAPPLKARNKRLLVTSPPEPDPTRRKWPYGFDGPYFRFLERDPKTGELLCPDPCKNASYVGVIPAPTIVLAGFRDIVQQSKASSAGGPLTIAPAAGTSLSADLQANVSTAAAAATAASDRSASSSSSTAGSEGLNASGSVCILKASDPKVISVSALSTVAAPKPGSDVKSPVARAASLSSAEKAAVSAMPRGRSEGEGSLLSISSIVAVSGGISAVERDAGVKKPTRPREVVGQGGAKRSLPSAELRAQILKAEEELKLLQENEIPRVMEALADVSTQRRKLEASVVSVRAQSAEAGARLVQDSRDAAAALMSELRAKRDASLISRAGTKSDAALTSELRANREAALRSALSAQRDAPSTTVTSATQKALQQQRYAWRTGASARPDVQNGSRTLPTAGGAARLAGRSGGAGTAPGNGAAGNRRQEGQPTEARKFSRTVNGIDLREDFPRPQAGLTQVSSANVVSLKGPPGQGSGAPNPTPVAGGSASRVGAKEGDASKAMDGAVGGASKRKRTS